MLVVMMLYVVVVLLLQQKYKYLLYSNAKTNEA